MERVLRHRHDHVGVPAPIERGHDLYLLVEAPTGEAGVEVFENFLAEMYEKGLVKDAVIAKSRAERDKLWALRESVYEYGKFLPQAVGFDVSIPLNRMPEAVASLRRDMPKLGDDIVWVVFGHIADCNLHVNVMPPQYSKEIKLAIEHLVYDLHRLAWRVGVGRARHRPHEAALSVDDAHAARTRLDGDGEAGAGPGRHSQSRTRALSANGYRFKKGRGGV